MINKAEYESLLQKKRAIIEEELNEHLKANKELRELFQKYPERREMYIEKILDSSAMF